MDTHTGHYLVVWEFHVKPGAQLRFEKFYGIAGEWCRLFKRSSDYGGSELLGDLAQPGRYLTFDRWTSREAFHRFKQAHGAEYDAMDKQCEALTDHESMLGEFESLSGSPMPGG